LTRQARLLRQRLVDALRLPVEIRVERAHDDTGMIRLGGMKPHEVPAVQR